jgi:hypothetical protein
VCVGIVGVVIVVSGIGFLSYRLERPSELKAKPKKAKVKKEPKTPKIATFPCKGFVNKYHFMRVSPAILEALGWKLTGDRLAVEIDLVNGELVIRKPTK